MIAKRFPNWSGWNHLVETARPRIALFNRIIKQHKEVLSTESPRDFVDAYLQEAKLSGGNGRMNGMKLRVSCIICTCFSVLFEMFGMYVVF
jgi:hypothetical protein